MSILLRIAERAINRPLLIHPDKVPIILGVLDGRIPLGDISDLRRVAEERIAELPQEAQVLLRGPRPQNTRFVGSSQDKDPLTGQTKSLPYQRTPDGTAIITITGSLINRGAWIGSDSGETSYEGIGFQIATAVNDPRSHAILLDIESPGGEAVGAMEAAAAIRAANEKKPVFAIVNGMAASAAYALASGARKIITAPSGVVGSIGVVMLHADYSRALDKKGITPTFIFAGAHKVDGNPLEPLTDSVKSDLQREVNQFYDLFVETVAAGRKSLSAKSIRDTEARVFIGEEAVKAGLADEVGTFESALAELSAFTARSRASFRGVTMSEKTGQPAAENAGNTISLEAHKAEVEKEKTAAHAAGKAEGVKEGATTEQARLATILGSDKVKGKEAHALRLATESPDMSAEKVIAFVASLPAATAGTIENRMAGQGPGLALGGPLNSPAGDPSGGWDAAAATVNKQFGVSPKQ